MALSLTLTSKYYNLIYSTVKFATAASSLHKITYLAGCKKRETCLPYKITSFNIMVLSD